LYPPRSDDPAIAAPR